jgi:glycosyltransferase involved in cell wall biosynthesis
VEHYLEVPAADGGPRDVGRSGIARALGLTQHCLRSALEKTSRAIGALVRGTRRFPMNLGWPGSRRGSSVLPPSIRYFSRLFGSAFKSQIKKLIADHGPFDLVDADQYVASWLPAALWQIPRIATFYDVLSSTLKRQKDLQGPDGAGCDLDVEAMVRYEQQLGSVFDFCVAVSEYDEKRLRDLSPVARVRVVRNGTDSSHYSPANDGDVLQHSIFFSGNMSYPPNVDAVAYFSSEVYPTIKRRLSRATFNIIGAHPAPEVCQLARDGIIVTGYLADIRPSLRNAGVVVAPLRLGGGTRLKILEALAMGKPVVSTTIGCEGLNVRHGEHLLIADDAADFAESVVRLMQDRDLCAFLGRNGRRLVENEYSYASSAGQLADVYDLAVRKNSPSAKFGRLISYARLRRRYWGELC